MNAMRNQTGVGILTGAQRFPLLCYDFLNQQQTFIKAIVRDFMNTFLLFRWNDQL